MASRRGWFARQINDGGNYHPARGTSSSPTVERDLADALEVRIAGYFATGSSDNRSYASGYGEYPDIWLAQSVEIDSATGELEYDEEDRPILKNGGILVRSAEIEYAQFYRRKSIKLVTARMKIE